MSEVTLTLQELKDLKDVSAVARGIAAPHNNAVTEFSCDITGNAGSASAAASGSALESEIQGKAPNTSPAFTGTPQAPTAAPGTDTNQIATTAFVGSAVSAVVDGAGADFDTLKELADRIDNDAGFAGSMNALINAKADSTAVNNLLTRVTALEGQDFAQAAAGLPAVVLDAVPHNPGADVDYNGINPIDEYIQEKDIIPPMKSYSQSDLFAYYNGFWNTNGTPKTTTLTNRFLQTEVAYTFTPKDSKGDGILYLTDNDSAQQGVSYPVVTNERTFGHSLHIQFTASNKEYEHFTAVSCTKKPLANGAVTLLEFEGCLIDASNCTPAKGRLFIDSSMSGGHLFRFTHIWDSTVINMEYVEFGFPLGTPHGTVFNLDAPNGSGQWQVQFIHPNGEGWNASVEHTAMVSYEVPIQFRLHPYGNYVDDNSAFNEAYSTDATYGGGPPTINKIPLTEIPGSTKQYYLFKNLRTPVNQ